VTHTLGFHAVNNGLLNIMIEVKNNLLHSSESRANMALTLAALISKSAAGFGYTVPPGKQHAANT
jgi:predicted N-formylglutamate amidohydrolase